MLSMPEGRPPFDAARLTYLPIDSERDARVLAAWLSRCSWPYHPTAEYLAEELLAQDQGEDPSDDFRSYWVVMDEASRVGRIVILRPDEITAAVSFRILAPYRGRGIGTRMVEWVAEHVFTTEAAVRRLEAETRIDNVGMRRALRRCGWVLEGCFRRSWRDGYDPTLYHDRLLYALLREDWEAGAESLTPVPWPWEELGDATATGS